MKLPDGIPEELKEALAEMMGGSGRTTEKCHKGTCDCQQVLSLSPEGRLKLKTMIADTDKLRRRYEILKSELKAVLLDRDRVKDNFWEWVYETFGLHSETNYHYTDDGRIMKVKGDD